MRRRARARALRRVNPGPMLGWMLLALALLLGAMQAHAQTTPSQPGSAPLQTAPPEGPKDGVVKPPAQVDPSMTKAAPPATTFPTPVVKPPAGEKQAK